jgi:hypothetical protein
MQRLRVVQYFVGWKDVQVELIVGMHVPSSARVCQELPDSDAPTRFDLWISQWYPVLYRSPTDMPVTKSIWS